MSINNLLIYSGMTLKQFSEYFNIPYKTAIKWKNGERECSSYLLELMEYKLKHEDMIKKNVNISVKINRGENMKINYEDYISCLLMNKNTPVLQFWYDKETHSIIKIEKILNESYAPLGIVDYKMGISRKAFNDWWENRSIPASRENFSRIMQQLNINSSMELLEKCAGFSLSDQYWIKETDSKAEWKDLNFFDNDFSEDIGKILLGQTDVHFNLDMVSPDNASDGDLIKKWKIINGERFLIKGGNSYNNQEPFNEVIASRLFERILEPGEYVPYSLIKEEGVYYSACKTMVSKDEELVSALFIDRTIKMHGNQSFYTHFVLACEKLGIKDIEIKLSKMLTCDYILANYDRHYRNFGAIRNVETLDWKGFAPLYDSGSSLWAKTHTSEISNSKYKSKPFKTDPKEQFEISTDLSWLDEERLIGFDKDIVDILSQNPLMDEQRISTIVRNVEKRIKIVLERKKTLEIQCKMPLDTTINSCEKISIERNTSINAAYKKDDKVK